MNANWCQLKKIFQIQAWQENGNATEHANFVVFDKEAEMIQTQE